MFRGYIHSMYSSSLLRIDNVEELVHELTGHGIHIINIQQRPIYSRNPYPHWQLDDYSPNWRIGTAITIEYMDTRGFTNSKTFMIGDTILFTLNDFCVLDDRSYRIRQEIGKKTTLIMDTE